MKKILYLLLAVINYGAASCNDFNGIQRILEQPTIMESHEDGSQKLKCMSYNIQLSGLDNPQHLWRDRKYAVAKLLSYADVFAT